MYILLGLILALILGITIYVIILKYFNLAKRDTFHYLKDNSLGQKMLVKKIEFKNKGEAYNPSIILRGDDMYMIVRLTTPSLSLNFSSKRIKVYDNTFFTCKFKNLDWDNLSEESESFVLNGIPGCASEGTEDPRIFSYKGSLYFSCVLVNDKCGVDTYIGKLNSRFNDIDYIYQVNPVFDKSKKQKNWNFFMELDNEMYFNTAIEPHTIVRVDSSGNAHKMFETSNPILKQKYPKKLQLRGSSKVVKISSDYLIGVGHLIVDKPVKTYKHFFYVVENKEPYKIIEITKEFCFPDRFIKDDITGCSHIQFCSGLELVGDTLWISFGVMDKYSYIAKIKLKELSSQIISQINHI